ncbi:MAG: sigma-70 family RNA polymerase sigma factor [Planctomycetota bacterium]|jgi:RNA polymerase sigma factor (TIGR02999 family)
MTEPSEVTATLDRIRTGDTEAKTRLVELIYEDLKAAAQRLMRHERPDHTLQPTALVNESLLRLMDTTTLGRLDDRNHLLAAATVAFKRVLIDHARARATAKRGGGRTREPLHEASGGASPDPTPSPDEVAASESPFDALLAWYDERGMDILALDAALDELRELDQRWFDVILLRFFGGFTIEQTAGLIGVSPRTVAQAWSQARAWLRVRLGDEVAGVQNGANDDERDEQESGSRAEPPAPGAVPERERSGGD